MTGQTLLNLMEGLGPELQLQSGEADQVKGLLFLNAVQDVFESMAAQYPQFKGGGVGTITTTINQEYVTFPSGLLRLDGLDMLGTDNLPAYPLSVKRQRGGHRYGSPFWWNYITSTTTTAKPAVYWTNGSNIYLDPVPDAVYSLRYYGFIRAADITASGTFAYDDIVALPLAALATKIIRTGLDDPTQDIMGIAKETLNQVIDALSGFNRDGAHDLIYTYNHDT